MGDAPLTARDIADKLDLKRHPRSWRGDCPSCSYGRVFSVRAGDQDRPRLFCANGCSPENLADAVHRATGGELRPKRQDDDGRGEDRRRRRHEAALRLWRGSAPLDHPYAAPVLAYMAARGISAIGSPEDIRFRPDCHHPEMGNNLPAMVALVRDAAGEPIGVHRTYLRRDGHGKASIEPDKASLGPIWGGAVRLTGDKVLQRATPCLLVIGEGIESSAAASILLGIPAWAALSAGNLGRGFQLPPSVLHVVIAADHDPLTKGKRPGQDAAAAAAQRWRAEGRRVDIAMPDKQGHDFADVLMERAHG